MERARTESDPTEIGTTVRRLQRAQTQLTTILGMLEEGHDCADAVTRIAAVSRGLDRVGFVLTATGLPQCLSRAGGEDATDVQRLKKLFLSLA